MTNPKLAVIGLDIGGTKLSAYLTTGAPGGFSRLTHPTPAAAQPSALSGLTPGSDAYRQALDSGRAALLTAVNNLCRTLIESAPQHGLTVAAVGIGSAGQIDPQTGVVLDANENLVGWKGTPLADSVSAATDLPVYVDNDVRVMALAECTFGAAAGYHEVLCITVGTGIGGALVRGGKVWHGAHASAGEIGYLRADGGETIESRYAGPGVVRHYPGHNDKPTSLVEMAQRAGNGDIACASAIESAAEGLGRCLAPVFALLDPQAVVIGGGVPEIGERWWQPFLSAVRGFVLESVRTMPVLPAQLGPDAGMIGAGVLAAQKAGLL